MKQIGHRACMGHNLPYPPRENTLLAIQYALESKIDMIEIDIRFSQDDCLVLSHDRDLERLHQLSTQIRNLPASILEEKYQIPTLQQVIKMVDGRLPIMLDLKEFSSSFMKKVIQDLSEVECGHILVGSFHHPSIQKYRSLLQKMGCRVGMIMSGYPTSFPNLEGMDYLVSELDFGSEVSTHIHGVVNTGNLAWYLYDIISLDHWKKYHYSRTWDCQPQGLIVNQLHLCRIDFSPSLSHHINTVRSCRSAGGVDKSQDTAVILQGFKEK